MEEAIDAAHGEDFDLLLGRRTYDIWSGYWPKAGKSPMADSLNAATKYVATHKPDSLGWGPVKDLGPDIVEGMDELGVLLAGHERNAYWYGSQLAIEEARRHVGYANASTVQVTAGAIAAVLWAIRNPRRGVVEPEDLDFEECLAVAGPYLGRMVGEFTDWTPLDGRGKYFPEELDAHNPWQLQNILSRQWRGQ